MVAKEYLLRGVSDRWCQVGWEAVIRLLVLLSTLPTPHTTECLRAAVQHVEVVLSQANSAPILWLGSDGR